MVRSSPMPVSTFLRSKGVKVPSAERLYCIKTLFHISRYLPQSQAGEQFGPQAGLPVSINISVSGPQGPGMPAAGHQLFSLGR